MLLPEKDTLNLKDQNDIDMLKNTVINSKLPEDKVVREFVERAGL